MKKQTKIALFLLFLSPAMGELLSGSAPPLEFFNPAILFMLVLLYGCGTLLIREAKARWGLQWSIIFLAVAYGIIEEGLMVKSFFNPGWQDLDKLSEYGSYLGVQWVWTIMLTIFHATISTLIPIAITESIWPEYKNVPLLEKRGLKLAFAGLILITVLGMILFGTEEDGEITPYYPHPLLLIFSFAIVLLLIWMAHRWKSSRISTSNVPIFPPVALVIVGFLFQFLNVLPFALSDNDIPATTTLIYQGFEIVFILLFIVYQICHRAMTERHLVSLIFGSILFFLIFGPIAGFNNGMLAVGVIGFCLLIWWRRTVLKNTHNGKNSPQDGAIL